MPNGAKCRTTPKICEGRSQHTRTAHDASRSLHRVLPAPFGVHATDQEHTMLHLFAAALALSARVVLPAEDSAQVRREELMSKLRSGGYSVLLRHARTDYSFKEETGSVPKERNQQRNLSDDGIRDAALMGVVFRKYGIGFSEIIV